MLVNDLECGGVPDPTRLIEGTNKCRLCAKECVLKNGERGRSRARIHRNGVLKSLVYGRPAAVHVDPLEKKPSKRRWVGFRSMKKSPENCFQRDPALRGVHAGKKSETASWADGRTERCAARVCPKHHPAVSGNRDDTAFPAWFAHEFGHLRSLYAADVVGGAIGAVVCWTLLFPLIGLNRSVFLQAGMFIAAGVGVAFSVRHPS
jgi:hypothetical protein